MHIILMYYWFYLMIPNKTLAQVNGVTSFQTKLSWSTESAKCTIELEISTQYIIMVSQICVLVITGNFYFFYNKLIQTFIVVNFCSLLLYVFIVRFSWFQYKIYFISKPWDVQKIWSRFLIYSSSLSCCNCSNKN